eukprot:GHRR01032981.1.p1 GENE.GHRR01032981.1~~GHRR01032981.1.p1  ORF type:complete len:410 (+),score=138.23 GHRR01032981.1:137-1366(+)
MHPAGLACPCNAWRWQLQDLVRQQKMNPGADATSYSAVGFEPDKQQHHNQHQQPQPQFICGHVTQLIANSSCQPLQQHWQQQHQHTHRADQEQRMLVCVLDNRGVGNSSSPTDTAAYSSRLMAEDVLAVMDHLRWDQAHILGFSMGGMVAQALAVAAPGRVQSLTLLSTSAGGWQIIPSSWTGLKTAVKMITARTPENAADATLHMHFRRRTLKAWVGHLAARRQELLRREYMTPGNGPPQPHHGFKGQLLACWRHTLSRKDANAIKQAGFPVLVIHGRNDKLASAANAESLARRLAAPCVILPGAHFIVRECAGQINMLLSSLVLGKQHITAITNGPYLDPSPLVQEAWRQQALKLQTATCSVQAAQQHAVESATAAAVAAGLAAGAAATATVSSAQMVAKANSENWK